MATVLPVVDTPRQRGIGVIAPGDFALDRELWRWVPDDVSLHVTRLPVAATPMTVERALALGEVEAVREATQRVLVPEPAVVAYACAAGSFVGGARGEHALRRAMCDAGAPTACTTSGALVEALRQLGVTRLAILTGYGAPVARRLVAHLAEHRVQVVAGGALGLMGNVWPGVRAEAADLAPDVDDAAEALFISAPNVPTYDLIAPLQRAVGKPVLTADQVVILAALRALDRVAA